MINKLISKSLRKYLNEVISSEENVNDNFRRWFDGSKIVNNGTPLICYHGSNSNKINKFDISKIGSNSGNFGHYGYGIYLSTSEREAKTYGDFIYKCYVKIVKPFIGSDDQLLELKNNGLDGIDDLINKSIDFTSFKNSFKNKPNIFKFLDDYEKYGSEKAYADFDYVNNSDILNDLTDIIEYTTLNSDVNGVPDFILDLLVDMNIKPKINKGFEVEQSLHWVTDLGKNSSEFTNMIINLGYDGVHYGSEIVVFKSNQIKSLDNDGSWDGGDDNIYS